VKYEGVIFDLDGTLVNSLDDIADSMNKVLKVNGFPSHDTQAYKYFIGNGLRNLVRRALPEQANAEDLVSKYFDLMMEEYRSHCVNKTRPYEGITELLDELTLRKIKLAVFSNKVDELTKRVVAELLPDYRFEMVIGNCREIPRKPNPMGAMLISKKLRISPQKLTYMGDTGVDMQTARSAGMYAVGVLWGFRTSEELIANGANQLLAHPQDFLRILEVGKGKM
jgi:phosphoglycolate phosphatase